jgi:flagellar motor switch protein FliG
MFVFEDLTLVDDRGLQKLLRAVETKELAMALKAASAEVREKISKNLSEKAREMLMEEIDLLGPVRMKDVEDAQQMIIKIVQEMEAKKELMIWGRGGEEIVA